MITWDGDLVTAIAKRRCVIVIGSGVSKNSKNKDSRRPKSWLEFLEHFCTVLHEPPVIKKLIEQRDFLTACQLIKRIMGEENFNKAVKEEFVTPGYLAADIHKHIYNLDSSVVVSPNFDVIYETYATSVSQGTITVKNHYDPDIAEYISGGSERLILKSHGSASNPNNLIFTRNDYAAARTKYQLFYEILKSLALTHKFIFFGCGIDDPDIRLLFEDIQFAHGKIPFHYMSLPDGEVDTQIMEVASESMRLRFLTYSIADGHKELTDSLAELVQLVETRREELAASRTW